MVKVALFVRLEAKAGKESAVESFLMSGLPLVMEEPATTAWFGIRLGPTTFGIFDAFDAWFRQEDFPQNRVLYGKFGAKAYAAWLRRVSVRYVVLTSARPDYSSRAEARLLRSGRSGLTPVYRTATTTIFAFGSALR